MGAALARLLKTTKKNEDLFLFGNFAFADTRLPYRPVEKSVTQFTTGAEVPHRRRFARTAAGDCILLPI
jgi:hypothetical protein